MGDPHDSFRSFVTRARLIAANSNAANQVILIFPRTNKFDDLIEDPNPDKSLITRRARDLVEQMNRWLDHLGADHVAGTAAERVARNRPADLVDACWTIDGRKITAPIARFRPLR